MKRLSDLFQLGLGEDIFRIGSLVQFAWMKKERKTLHLFALGDVGGTLLTGLKLLGGDQIEEIGIYDIRETMAARYEMEMNQIREGDMLRRFPPVRVLKRQELFQCDVFLFCASLGVPPVEESVGDVRMAQYQANAGLIREIAGEAAKARFSGLFAVISDPVDPLCRTAASAGLAAEQIKGFGLGVMNARAAYYAERDSRFSSYLTEGAAFGPHGEDLIIANSLSHYDDAVSRELTTLTSSANLRVRELGYKPYLAPALSSGALSILAVLSGRWHYSSSAFGEVFFGAKNRLTEHGIEVENPKLPDELFARLEISYRNLKELDCL
ncbi:lactate dehydrogenase [Hominifimenecus sp. rT4P-3]|uniref:lactate dehydrogenase n=1 Tax=Hominifimenecus sp. rT4P-3 TaxID=3242979 RepID=UPI003DA4BE01